MQKRPKPLYPTPCSSKGGTFLVFSSVVDVLPTCFLREVQCTGPLTSRGFWVLFLRKSEQGILRSHQFYKAEL